MGASESTLKGDRNQAQAVCIGEGGPAAVRRNVRFPDKLIECLYDDVRTLHENFHRAVSLWPNKNYLGTRANSKAPYTWLTYADAAVQAKEFGSGLLTLGLKAKGEGMLGILSKNRAEWIIAAQGANNYSIPTVPLYDTLGASAVAFIVNQAELAVVACSPQHTATLLKESENMPVLKTIVQWDTVSEEDKEAAKKAGVTLLSFDEVREAGRKAPADLVPPSPSDLATICYTSGTTGDPKGAMMTHANMIADVSAVILTGVDLRSDDVHMSYLPLAHMFERAIQEALVLFGASSGFFQGDILKLFDDINCLRPTIFCSVPRLFNKLYDKINAGITAKGGLSKALFDQGFAAKKQYLPDGWYTHAFWDSLVFNKIAAKVGGRVRLMVTGSAPISPEVLDFLRICFSCPVLEGYGQTETGAAATLTAMWDTSAGHVGAPLPCNEVRLDDVPEMSYTSADKPYPRGEICYRGPNIFQGYFHNEAKTAEALDADGWLHSGDIGMWLPNGTLKIIDRKKDIFKLAQGEYVAAAKIENIYAKAPLVAQSFVYGDSLKSALVAIVVPDAEQLVPFAREKLGLAETDLAALCKLDVVRDAIHEEMTRIGKESKLHGFELAKAIRLTPELFSVENGLYTPTFKLKRPQAKATFKAEIDDAYAELHAKGKA
jgi:long-chain acyl-CoA synthetase